MTISANDRRKEYAGNGVTTVFTGPRAFADAHIAVYLVDDATDVATLTTAYTLTGVGVRNRATTVTMDTAPADGKTLLILRTVPTEQATSITNQGAYLPGVVEDALDALAQQSQQLDERIARSARLPDALVLGSIDATLPVPEPLNVWAWNEAATALENYPLAQSDAAFSQSDSATARTVRAKLREVGVSADDHAGGAAISGGAVSAVAAINAAASSLAGSGGVVHLSTGTFQIDAPLTLPAGVVLRGKGPNTRLRAAAFTYLFDSSGSISSDLTNTLASNTGERATTVTLAAGKGANFAAGDYVLVSSEAGFAEGGSSNKRGEIARVQGIAGDVVTLESQLNYAYNTADTARVRKITMLSDIGLEDMSITGAFNANPTFTRGQSIFEWCLRPRIRNVNFSDYNQQAVALCGCVHAQIEGCDFVDLDSDDSTSFGYCVVEIGPNIGNRITNCTAQRIRHAYTTVDSANYFTLGYGQPIGTRISDCHAVWPRAAGFDTHEAGDGISFSDCTVTGGGRAGFQVRSTRTVVENCRVTDCIGEGIYVDSSAIDSVLTNNRLYRTNSGTYLATDRTDRGAIFDNGARTVATGNTIEFCGGPAIEAFDGARDFDYSNNRIRNPAQLTATNTHGIRMAPNAATTGTLIGNRLVSSDGLVTIGYYAANGNISGWATGNRVIGSVATPYDITGFQHQGNIPGPLLSAGRGVNVTIAAGVLAVGGVNGAVLQVEGEGAAPDDLVTISGGVAGQVLYIKRQASNTITVKHGTGNIFLNGGTDKVLGGSFDVLQLVRIGSSWIGGFLADV